MSAQGKYQLVSAIVFAQIVASDLTVTLFNANALDRTPTATGVASGASAKNCMNVLEFLVLSAGEISQADREFLKSRLAFIYGMLSTPQPEAPPPTPAPKFSVIDGGANV